MGSHALKYILAIVLVLLAATVYFVTRPAPEYEVGKNTATEATEEAAPAKQQPAAADSEAASGDARVAAMKAEFEDLEKARHNLERRLSRLKAVLYGIDIPAEERKTITENMKNGYGLLKHKKLMASYDGPEEISNELSRVEYISQYLKEVENKYRQIRQQERSAAPVE